MQLPAPAPILPAKVAVASSSGPGNNPFGGFGSVSVELREARVCRSWCRPLRKRPWERNGFSAARRLPWAFSCWSVLLGVVGLWAGGVFKVKTKDGTIVLQNLPPDADVTVDGETVKIKAADGKMVEIRVAADKKHRLEVKKDGFKVFGDEIELDAGERKPILVKLQPEDRPVPPKPASEDKEKWVSLFNGKNLDGWVKVDGNPTGWKVDDGVLEVVPGQGNIMTRQIFGPDFELHAEFNIPLYADRKGQGRGNSGIFILGRRRDSDPRFA